MVRIRAAPFVLVAVALVATLAFAAPPAVADSCSGSVTVLGCPPGSVPWPTGGKTNCGGGPPGWSCAYLW